MTNSKTCSTCEFEKDKTLDFSVNRANPDGYDYFCKDCKSAKAKNRRRRNKIYMSAAYGFDTSLPNNYIIKNCEVCNDVFYPIRSSHKRCSRCTYLVRDTQSHLSGARNGNKNIKQVKCSVVHAIQIVKLLIASNKCCYCGRQYTDFNQKSIDHVIPVVRGGGHNIDNINICCLQCNLSKRDLLLSEWIDLCRRVSENA